MVWVVAAQEFSESVRTRWFVTYGAALTALVSALAGLTLSGTPAEGVAGRAAAGLVHLVLLAVPLLGLHAGSLAIAGERERGSLAYLLAQPLSRAEVFWGKLAGLAFSLTLVVLAAFGTAGIVLALQGTPLDGAAYLTVVGLAVLLSGASLSVGYLISATVRRVSTALGASVFAWLALAFLTDLGLMGTALTMDLGIWPVFVLSLLNPLQVFKVAALASLQPSLEVLGPVGLFAVDRLGSGLVPLFVGLLATWCAVPALMAWHAFSRGEYL